MHHGTCVTHVPWCIPGSLTRGAGITFPAFLAHAQPAILRIWYEAHCLVTTILHQAVDMFLCLSVRIQYAINLVLGDSSCHHAVCSSHPRSFQSTCNTTSSHNKIFKLSNRFEIRQLCRRDACQISEAFWIHISWHLQSRIWKLTPWELLQKMISVPNSSWTQISRDLFRPEHLFQSSNRFESLYWARQWHCRAL